MMLDAAKLSVGEMRSFLAGSGGMEFELPGREARWAFVARVLSWSEYPGLRKAGKGIVRRYLERVTGLQRAQLTRLTARWRREHELRAEPARRTRFARRFTREDVELLARVDEAHEGLSGAAVRRVLQREYGVYGRAEFQRLAGISVAHIYNLRRTLLYRRKRLVVEPTEPQRRPRWAERRKPEPAGAPGYLRVDTVHQGREDGRPGPYHINAVDTVTQWEVICCCQSLSELELGRAVQALLAQFPFRIRGFHSDNGGEYINQVVGRLLRQRRIEFTASRPSRATDNALVEGKNGAVVRRWMGWGLLGQEAAARVQCFFREELNPYLNFHRPCGFAEISVDPRGRRRRHYQPDQYRTPFEKLQSLPDWESYLKPGVTRESLEREAQTQSDTAAAGRVQAARNRVFAPALWEIKPIPVGRAAESSGQNGGPDGPPDSTRLGGARGRRPLAPHPTPPNTQTTGKEAPR
jgi:hypothetical protein